MEFQNFLINPESSLGCKASQKVLNPFISFSPRSAFEDDHRWLHQIGCPESARERPWSIIILLLHVSKVTEWLAWYSRWHKHPWGLCHLLNHLNIIDIPMNHLLSMVREPFAESPIGVIVNRRHHPTLCISSWHRSQAWACFPHVLHVSFTDGCMAYHYCCWGTHNPYPVSSLFQLPLKNGGWRLMWKDQVRHHSLTMNQGCC